MATRTLSGTRSASGARTNYNRSQNYSMSLNGTTDYVFIVGKPTIYTVCNNIYSIEFWVKGATQNGKTLWQLNRSTGNALYQLTTLSSGKLSYFVRNDGGTVLANGLTGNSVFLDSTWHHCVLTDSAGTVKFYVDSVLDSATLNYTLSGAFSSLNVTTVGASYNGTTASALFSGKLDQVRIYNIALNQSQVNAAYANSGYPTANIMYDLSFNEGSGTVINNKGFFGPEWKLVGGTFSTDVPASLEPITRVLI